MSLLGVDVSAYQPNINWGSAKSFGHVSFVFAKATEGVGYVDDQFVRNHDQCKTLGIPFGAYHFYRFGRDPIQQAEHFLGTIDGRGGPLLPMVDVEGGGQDGVTDLGTFVKSLGAFNKHVEDAIGEQVIIYSDYGDWNGFMQGTDAFAGHPLWIAAFNNDPAPPIPNGFKDWVIWQFSDAGRIPGIPGAVDLDRLNGNSLNIISRSTT